MWLFAGGLRRDHAKNWTSIVIQDNKNEELSLSRFTHPSLLPLYFIHIKRIMSGWIDNQFNTRKIQSVIRGGHSFLPSFIVTIHYQFVRPILSLSRGDCIKVRLM